MADPTAPPEVIGNTPDFNPGAASVQRRGGGFRRGRRFKWLAIGGVVVFTAGLIVLQQLFQNWHSDAKAELRVKESTAEPPSYLVEANLPTIELPPMPAATAPPPPKEQPRVERPQTRRSGAERRRDLPSGMTWNIQVQGEPPGDWFVNGMRPMIAKGCALRPGASVIPAVLNTVVDSTVTPGQVIATVSENIYDVDGVGRLLIPQGTKMVGAYRNALQFGQLRLGIVWTEATMPDGTQITLDEANGMDVAGSMGMGGDVDTNWGRIIAVASIFTIFDAAQRATVPDDNSFTASLSDAGANQFARVGTRAVNKILDSAVVIRIPAGTQLNISPSKTIQVCQS